MRPATAAALAFGRLPDPPHGWGQALRLDGPADLTVFLDKVGASYPFFDTSEHIARIAREAVLDAAADGQDYLELRFGPATHARDGLPISDVVAAACVGLREGIGATRMPAGIVVAALRSPRHRETLGEVARAAVTHAGEGVVGFDLAGDELRYPELEPYVEAFAIARAAGLGLTCHVAEAAPATYARRAVELFGITRIGHGTAIASDPDVLEFVRDHGVVVECCPTSNWCTGAIPAVAAHPARALLTAGVPIVLGDDNPVQTGSSLPAEREVLRRDLGFSAADLHALDRTSIAAAFLDPGTRTRLTGTLKREAAGG